MMLRYLKMALGGWMGFGFILGLAAPVHAAGTEAITNYIQTASIESSDTLKLTDEIFYDFGDTAPHPITHRLPVNYYDNQGREFRINFKLISAKLDGQPITLTPKITTATAELTLPPGSGTASTRQYQLVYELTPVVLRGDTADIVRLNVTGLGWTVPINQASLKLTSPVAPENATCYTGAQGMTTGSCTVTQEGNVTKVVSYAVLQPGESFGVTNDYPQKSFTAYLEPYEKRPNPVNWMIAEVAAAVLLLLLVPIAIIRFRQHTKANDSAKNQADRH